WTAIAPDVNRVAEKVYEPVPSVSAVVPGSTLAASAGSAEKDTLSPPRPTPLTLPNWSCQVTVKVKGTPAVAVAGTVQVGRLRPSKNTDAGLRVMVSGESAVGAGVGVAELWLTVMVCVPAVFSVNPQLKL